MHGDAGDRHHAQATCRARLSLWVRGAQVAARRRRFSHVWETSNRVSEAVRATGVARNLLTPATRVASDGRVSDAGKEAQLCG